MKFIKYFIYIIVVFIFQNNMNIEATDVFFDDIGVYNYAISSNYIAVEYEKKIENEILHYIGLYNLFDGNFYDVLSNKGELINNDMFFPSISKDGNYLVFTSRASNITNDQLNTCYDISDSLNKICNNIYLYNTLSKEIVLINNEKDVFNGDNYIAKISGDGNHIVFESISSNLLKDKYDCSDFNGISTCINIFKYNILTRKFSLVSTGKNNFGGDKNSVSPSISDDGRYITFQSSASNIIELSDKYNYCYDNNTKLSLPCSNIYLVDTVTLNYKLISKDKNTIFNDDSGNSIISGNGKFVAFESYSSSIVKYNNYKKHIYIYDVDEDSVDVLSNNNVLNNRDSNLRDLSDDGKYLIYTSNSTNLNNNLDIMNMYVYNVYNKKNSDVSNFKNDIIKACLNNNYLYYYDSVQIRRTFIDNISPIIDTSNEINILLDNIHSINNKIVVNDNLSDRENIELFVDDSVLLNEGKYKVSVMAIDEFKNVSTAEVIINVFTEDIDAPVFNEINEIKILKGSSTLNLSSYIKAIDNIDGDVRIYIVDDGKLDLNVKGKYTIKIMSKDLSNNTNYKTINIIVYENYNFSYFYEIFLVLFVIGGIIFLLIKVK